VADKGMEMEVKDLSAKFTTDIVGITAYGLNVNSLNNPDAEFRKYGKKIFKFNLIRGFEFLSIFFFPTLVRWTGMRTFGKEATGFLRTALWETLIERMKSGQRRNDLIDILIELRDTYKDQNIGGFSKQNDSNVFNA
jgi:cytochrome P450 family 6